MVAADGIAVIVQVVLAALVLMDRKVVAQAMDQPAQGQVARAISQAADLPARRMIDVQGDLQAVRQKGRTVLKVEAPAVDLASEGWKVAGDSEPHFNPDRLCLMHFRKG